MNIDKWIEQANQLFKEGKLTPLKNPFGGESFFNPVELDAYAINFPTDKIESLKFEDLSFKTLADLERDASFIAASDNPTISLFDTLKTQAAIDDCKTSGEKNTPFLLVSADFSGIQDTVYTISSKGALKTLRARSFMLELLTEHIIYELVGDKRYQIIYSGGGGFSLLTPNTQDNRDTLSKFREILNEWAIKEFSGKFFIALDAYAFSKIEEFAEARKAQSENLDKQKRRKFLNRLGDFFAPKMPKQTTVQTECQITRRDDLVDSDMCDLETGDEMTATNKNEEGRIWVSKSCFRQYKIGDKLISAEYVYRSDTKSNKYYFEFPKKNSGFAYYFVQENKEEIPSDSQIWKINGFEKGCYTLFYANYVRKVSDLPAHAQAVENDNGKYTATFDGLAASSCGADLIGALRMDIDNLGKNFQAVRTPAELSQKSRLLNLFFKGYLNAICQGNLNGLTPTNILSKDYSRGRNVSVIYAGGDDLFIVGAWDETAEVAFDIQKCFYQFTGGDANQSPNRLGISGGLTLHQPKFPLYQMAKKSGDAESVAKNESGQKSKKGLKNRLALFYADHFAEVERNGKLEGVNENDDRLMLSVEWKQMETIVQIVSFFAGFGKVNGKRLVLENLPNSFTYSLLDITREWHESGKLFIPHFLWLLRKHAKKFDSNGLDFIKRTVASNLPILHLPLMWIELLKRGQ